MHNIPEREGKNTAPRINSLATNLHDVSELDDEDHCEFDRTRVLFLSFLKFPTNSNYNSPVAARISSLFALKISESGREILIPPSAIRPWVSSPVSLYIQIFVGFYGERYSQFSGSRVLL